MTIEELIPKDWLRSESHHYNATYYQGNYSYQWIVVRKETYPEQYPIITNLNITVTEPIILKVHAYCMYNNYIPRQANLSFNQLYWYKDNQVIGLRYCVKC